MDEEGTHVLVDNTTNFSLHAIATGRHIAMFNTGEAKVKIPKQTTFGEGGAVVVVGSDDGKAYVFERGGNPDQVLEHAKDGFTQTVAVSMRMHVSASRSVEAEAHSDLHGRGVQHYRGCNVHDDQQRRDLYMDEQEAQPAVARRSRGRRSRDHACAVAKFDAAQQPQRDDIVDHASAIRLPLASDLVCQYDGAH